MNVIMKSRMRERRTYGSVRGLWREPLVYSTVKQLIKESGEESIPKRKIILQNKREDLVRSDKILQ